MFRCGLCKKSIDAEAVADVPNRFEVLCGLAASRAVIGLGLMLNGWPRPGASTRCPTDPSSTLGGIGSGLMMVVVENAVANSFSAGMAAEFERRPRTWSSASNTKAVKYRGA